MEKGIGTWITNFELLICNLEMMCHSCMSRELYLVGYTWQMMCHSCMERKFLLVGCADIVIEDA
jgi:hypothetical protein